MATRSGRKPLALRQLRAEMELQELSLGDVSDRSRIEYSMASAILNGRLKYLPGLEAIVAAIKNAPTLIDRSDAPELEAIVRPIKDAPPSLIDRA